VIGLNSSALVAVAAFAGVLLLVFGLLYRVARASYVRGELDAWGVQVIRWGLLGQLAILAILAITAFLT
jgi:hypothetical protein